MNEELDIAQATNFIETLRELLIEEAENVGLSNQQLTNFPDSSTEFIEIAIRKCKKTLTVRRKREAEEQARAEERARAEKRARAEEEARAQERARAEEQTRAEEHARAQERIKAEAEEREEKYLLDATASNSSHSNASRDPFNDFGNMRIANSSDPHNESDIPIGVTNETPVDFIAFIQEDGAYLMFQKQRWPESLQIAFKNELIDYPLGVDYDEKLQLWIICDRNTDKVVLVNIHTESIRVCEDIKQPTAVIVYEEGKSVAVLCGNAPFNSIYIYHHNEEESYKQAFATHEDQMYDMRKPLRGLAKSSAGNILSLERSRLRVFKRNVGAKAYEMRQFGNPSFISTYRTTVAVSDLGVNKVFIMNLDDKNWNSVDFNILKVIETTNSPPPSQLANQSGFLYVAGMQFDNNGHLLIGDARGHSIKLYDTDFNFLHRVSSDFVLPFVSSFHVNKDGDCILLDLRNKREKLIYVKMTSIPSILPWCPSKDIDFGQRNNQKPRRGGYQKNAF